VEAEAAECLAEEAIVEVLEGQLFGVAEADLAEAVLVVGALEVEAEVLVVSVVEVLAAAAPVVAGSCSVIKRVKS
jgi:hypothetical protein